MVEKLYWIREVWPEGRTHTHTHTHTYIWQSSLSYDKCVIELSFRIGSVGKFRG
jgi:hypothetical protein